MVDGLYGVHTPDVQRPVGVEPKHVVVHVQILLQLMVEMIAKDLHRTQGIVTLTHVLV